jgi:SAM-dependent methyltransferase
MSNPFASDRMAAGYANARPPVHPRVLDLAWRELGRTGPAGVALDLGCGAGVSTKALAGFAARCIGLDPVESMLRLARSLLPSASFMAGRAEAIPLLDHSVDLITAAGSLNYADLDLSVREAGRVLAREGVLLVYDFTPGRSFRDSQSLDDWFAEFYRRYPPPSGEARELSPEILAGITSLFRVFAHQYFEVAILLTPEFYLDYVMTETNVAVAIRRGLMEGEIKSWCATTLHAIWPEGARDVVFRGYFAALTPASASCPPPFSS